MAAATSRHQCRSSKLSLDGVAGEEERQFSFERNRLDLGLVLAAAELVLAENDGARVERRRVVRVVGLEEAGIEDDVRY